MTPNFTEVVQRARKAFDDGRTLSIEFRKQQLRQLRKMYLKHEQEFSDAVKQDLRKPMMEIEMCENSSLMNDIDHIIDHVEEWAKPESVSSQVPLDKSRIYHDPYGVVLVMGAWNYPHQLNLMPVHGAIAAGNCVIIKPSDLAPATAEALARLLPRYLDKDCFQVVCGGIPETTELLKQRFDYIFYTGSTAVGKIVREAANKFLTPTTLELGGKSPCFIDDSVNLDVAVRRILWGKMINFGQTCIAPDYVLCSKALQDDLVNKINEVLDEWYGDKPKDSGDLGRIVSEKHVDRLAGYLESGRVVRGGKVDRDDRWVEPAVLVDVPLDSKVMKEEIFGPILPIVNVENHVEAANHVAKGEKPLAFYIFSNREHVQELLLSRVMSGGVCVNDTIFHAAGSNMPFGGVGHSGMGSYHGKYSFDTFSHKKSCLIRGYNSLIEKILQKRYPPYTEENRRFFKSQKPPRSNSPIAVISRSLPYLTSVVLGGLIAFLIMVYTDNRKL